MHGYHECHCDFMLMMRLSTAAGGCSSSTRQASSSDAQCEMSKCRSGAFRIGRDQAHGAGEWESSDLSFKCVGVCANGFNWTAPSFKTQPCRRTLAAAPPNKEYY